MEGLASATWPIATEDTRWPYSLMIKKTKGEREEERCVASREPKRFVLVYLLSGVIW